MRVTKVFVLSLMWLQVQGQEPTPETPTSDTTPTTSEISETSETTPTPSTSSTTLETTPTTSETTKTTSSNASNSSNDFCDSSFKVGNELRDTHFIAAIVNSVMDKLRSNNVQEEMLANIPTIIGGNLYCDGNLPDTIDILLSYLYDKVDRDCFKISGYKSVYIKTD